MANSKPDKQWTTTFTKMAGISALDDFNAIKSAFGEAMFLIGIEYARRHTLR